MRVGRRILLFAATVLAAGSLVGAPAASGQHNSIELVTTGPAPSHPYSWVDDLFVGQKHSSDGRHVFFTTNKRLVPEDQDSGCSFGEPDIPDDCADVYERFDGRTRLVSFGGNGAYAAELDSVSADGRKAVFTTAESLLPQDTNAKADVYEWVDGSLSLVAQAASGGSLSLGSHFAGASKDGSTVFFNTEERLAPEEDQNTCTDIYVRSSGTVRMVSTGPADIGPRIDFCEAGPVEQPNDPRASFVSEPDGAHYFFYTRRTLVPEDRDQGSRDIYEYSNGTTGLVSTGPTADTCLPGSEMTVNWSRASADGSHVFFRTSDSLVPEDDNCARPDEYERDQSGVRLLDPPAVHDFSRSSGAIAVSADGSRVILRTNVRFSSADTDDQADLYARVGGTYELLSTGPVDRGREFIGDVQVSKDAQHVYFETTRQLVPEDVDDHTDVYDRFNGVTRLVTTGPLATTAESTTLGTISRDGTHAFFASDERLVAEDTDNFTDTYEWTDGHTYLVPTGVPTSGPVRPVSFGASDDGARVLLSSTARLTPDDNDDLADLYVATTNRPPDCSAVAVAPSILWPANGKLRIVELAGASDPDGDPVTLSVDGVTQDEPLTRRYDARLTTDPGVVRIRAARDPRGDGRVYRIAFTASDGSASCSGAVKVSVPRHRNRAAIDSAPPSYDSFTP
jgi:hypothetical protein